MQATCKHHAALDGVVATIAGKERQDEKNVCEHLQYAVCML